MSIFKKTLAFTLVLSSTYAFAKSANPGIIGPWMTGPLLAPSGHTIPAGHTNFEPYLFITNSYGFYNTNSIMHYVPRTISTSPTLIVSRGLAKRFDIQLSVPYAFNNKNSQSDNGFGDVGVVLGFQALNQTPKSWVPDLRLTIAETFPTGKYENGNAAKLGTDMIGAGSYQTVIGANFQKLHQFRNKKYLRTRLSLTYAMPTSVHVNGYNAYGGGINTDGTVTLGNKFAIDLGLEYTLTQHWVPALDITFYDTPPGGFKGTSGVNSSGGPAVTAPIKSEVISLAPAIEYNFSAKFGMIAGAWFTVYGRNAADFAAGVVAVNYYN